jgi:geranylgeranyl diphosphate synthase, type II
MADALSILQRHGQSVTDELERLLGELRDAPPKLVEAMRYSLLAGGKRIRPALVLESFRTCAGEVEGETNSSRPYLFSALMAAAAVELIHTFSLIHDDLPAMDDDDLRRGKPTNHKVFGEAMAILAGDAMVTMAFEVLATRTDPAVSSRLVAELAGFSGAEGMIGGQVLDIDGENRSLALEELQKIHRMKSGALLTASCRMGAIAAGADDTKLAAVTRFGRHLGLAFQIIDDILDVTSTPEQLGKATNKDAERGKNTYPAMLGIEFSRAEAQRQLDAAIGSLSDFSTSADGLRSLARFVVERNT